MEDTSTAEYIDLVSTACLDQYPQNRSSNFINYLPVAMEYPQGTMVSLQEVSYTNSFYNVTGRKNILTIFDPEFENTAGSTFNPNNTYSTYGRWVNVMLKEGYYPTIEKILEMLNSKLKNAGVDQLTKALDVFSYDKLSLKIHYNLLNVNITLFIKGPLLNILGCELNKYKEGEWVRLGKSKAGPTFEIEKPNPDDPDNPIVETRHYIAPETTWVIDEKPYGTFPQVAQLTNINSMVIYTDIITNQVCANSYVHSLRMIPVTGKDGDQVIYEVKKAHYLGLQKHYIKAIHIQIRSIDGEEISFLKGLLRVKLRFQLPNK